MNADESLASHRRIIGAVGETIYVRRYNSGAGARSFVDTATQARIVGYQPEKLVGGIVQGDRKVVALVDTLAAILPVRTSDKLVIRGREVAIKAVDDNTRRYGGTLVALEIQAAGA